MTRWNRYQKVLDAGRGEDFERRVNEAVANAVREMDKMVDDELKIKYVTHIFAKTLDQLQNYLDHPKLVN